MALATTTQHMSAALWARRLALFGLKLLVLAILLHRFGALPTPTLLATIRVTMAAGLGALLLALLAVVTIWRRGGSGVTAAIVGAVAGLGLGAWPAAVLPATWKTPALNDISTDTQSPPQFRELARLRDAGANPVAYPADKFAKLQAQAFPDIQTMIVTRASTDSFDLTREIMRRMKWTEVAARPASGASGIAEIEAQAVTPVLGYRDDIILRLKAERDKTRIDIRSASPYGVHDLGRNVARVRALMQELHIRLDLGVPMEPEQIAKRRRLRQKMLQARSQSPAGQTATQSGQSKPSSARERAQKPLPRSRDEGQDRGKRRRQSWE